MGSGGELAPIMVSGGELALVPATLPEVDMAAFPASNWVRASVVQASTVFGDTPATLVKAEKLIAEAAALGAQLVVFPEAFIGGYPRGCSFGAVVGHRSSKGREDFRKYYSCAIDVPGPETERLAAAAAQFKVHLVMGVVERTGGTLYCSIVFFDSQGRFLGKHRKCVPTAAERVIFGYGDGSTIPVFKTEVGQIGGLVCWENRMPLLRTALYAKGVEVYCAPTADARDTWQATIRHIAIEGSCFVLSCNQFCRRKDYPPSPDYTFDGFDQEPAPHEIVCSGGSAIFSPSGKVLAGPHYDGEAVLSAYLDLGEITRAKFEFDAVGHYSRPEVLSLTVNEKPYVPVTFVSDERKVNKEEPMQP